MVAVIATDLGPRLDSQRSAAPYPHRFERTHTVAAVLSSYGELAAGQNGETVRVAGRIVAVRPHRNITFVDVEDVTGRLQCAIPSSVSSPDGAAPVRLGDIAGFAGPVFRTRMGELTIMADELVVLAPCLRPLPDKWHGLRDTGQQRGLRHVDLLANPASRQRFMLRAQIIRAIRMFLWARGFVEVETSILDDAYGGAEAHPFTTHCDALGRDLFLRISPELPLKRLLVGGLERVYECGKSFRNEGIDARHHPEFTSIEIYEAYADYNDMMELTEALLQRAALDALGRATVVSRLSGNETVLDLTPPFRRITVRGGVREFTGADLTGVSDAQARSLAAQLGVPTASAATADEVLMALFEAKVESHLVQPTFVIDYPASLCPLTKRHRSDPTLAERFELYIDGLEFANAYSELNDPVEQRRQFEAQAQRRANGDALAHMPDWEFVEALEYGMPPAGGLGIGIDRLVMLFAGVAHLQDVILFPMRRGETTPPAALSAGRGPTGALVPAATGEGRKA